VDSAERSVGVHGVDSAGRLGGVQPLNSAERLAGVPGRNSVGRSVSVQPLNSAERSVGVHGVDSAGRLVGVQRVTLPIGRVKGLKDRGFGESAWCNKNRLLHSQRPIWQCA
jgi:hypothetical protein